MKNILIENCIILPMDRTDAEQKYYKGSIGIRGDKIHFVGDGQDEIEQFIEESGTELKRIKGDGKLAMPGLINIHGHVSMTLMRGFADDIPLMEWLNDHVWPFEATINGEDIEAGAELGIAEMLMGGTTTFVDMYWQQIDVAKAVERMGIRAVLSPTFTDIRMDDFEEDFARVVAKYGNGQQSRISLMIAPHSVYGCSRENLLRAKHLSQKYDIGLTIHVSETLDEQRTMRERIDMTPTEYLDQLGMLTPRTLVVHAVHVNESDIELIRKRGCSVAHNPHSNMKIASGIAPVVKMVKAGINVGIATDGASSNNDLDMWEELRTASFLQKVANKDPLVLPAYQMLEMATVNGAKALGMEDRIGRLKEGMLADIILINLEQPHLYPQHDLVANLVYCGKSSDVETVLVGGEIVVEGGMTVRADSVALCHAAQGKIAEIARR